MKRLLTTMFFVLFSKMVKGSFSRGAHVDIARFKISKMYIKSIETFRLLYLSLFGMGICLVFLMASLVLFHAVLFLYAPWSGQVKLVIGCLCAAVYLLVAIAIFTAIFTQTKWLEIFHAREILEGLRQKTHVEKETEEDV
jgi:hypothetical protein